MLAGRWASHQGLTGCTREHEIRLHAAAEPGFPLDCPRSSERHWRSAPGMGAGTIEVVLQLGMDNGSAGMLSGLKGLGRLSDLQPPSMQKGLGRLVPDFAVRRAALVA